MSEQVGCAQAVQRLWEYLDGGLDGTNHRAVEAHLAYCVRCCGELEFAKEIQRLLRAPRDDLPPDARDRMERFIDALGDAPGTGATT